MRSNFCTKKVQAPHLNSPVPATMPSLVVVVHYQGTGVFKELFCVDRCNQAKRHEHVSRLMRKGDLGLCGEHANPQRGAKYKIMSFSVKLAILSISETKIAWSLSCKYGG